MSLTYTELGTVETLRARTEYHGADPEAEHRRALDTALIRDQRNNVLSVAGAVIGLFERAMYLQDRDEEPTDRIIRVEDMLVVSEVDHDSAVMMAGVIRQMTNDFSRRQQPSPPGGVVFVPHPDLVPEQE